MNIFLFVVVAMLFFCALVLWRLGPRHSGICVFSGCAPRLHRKGSFPWFLPSCMTYAQNNHLTFLLMCSPCRTQYQDSWLLHQLKCVYIYIHILFVGWVFGSPLSQSDTHTHTHIMYVHKYICACLYELMPHAHIHKHSTCVHTYIHPCLHTDKHTYMLRYTCMQVHAWRHGCIEADVRTYIHMCTYIQHKKVLHMHA